MKKYVVAISMFLSTTYFCIGNLTPEELTGYFNKSMHFFKEIRSDIHNMSFLEKQNLEQISEIRTPANEKFGVVLYDKLKNNFELFFRGTCGSQWKDVLDALKINIPEKFLLKGFMHGGIARILDSLMSKQIQGLNDIIDNFVNEIENLIQCKQDKPCNIIISGESLGGAVACISSALIKEKLSLKKLNNVEITTITFGAPAIFDQDAVENFHKIMSNHKILSLQGEKDFIVNLKSENIINWVKNSWTYYYLESLAPVFSKLSPYIFKENYDIRDFVKVLNRAKEKDVCDKIIDFSHVGKIIKVPAKNKDFNMILPMGALEMASFFAKFEQDHFALMVYKDHGLQALIDFYNAEQHTLNKDGYICNKDKCVQQ